MDVVARCAIAAADTMRQLRLKLRRRRLRKLLLHRRLLRQAALRQAALPLAAPRNKLLSSQRQMDLASR